MKSLISKLSGLALIVAVAVGGLAVASEAQAGHYRYGHWQICYETQYVPYTVTEYAYDHCGYPYPIYRTYYKTVVIPVKKWIY
jgi:hypothetical protein